jgi:Transposase DDE domain
MQTWVDEEWHLLTSLLPQDWQRLAWQTGAVRRVRSLGDTEVLLRLLLLHVASGLSLRQTTARACAQGLASVSSVALFKRLRGCELWLQTLNERLLQQRGFFDSIPLQGKINKSGHRLRAVDATHVKESGPSGSTWRVHYSIGLPSAACDFFEVTDLSEPEKIERIPVEPGDIVLADRGYCRKADVKSAVDRGAHLVMRVALNGLVPLDSDGNKLALLPWLRQLQGQQSGSLNVQIQVGKDRIQGRFCAVRCNQITSERLKKQLRRKRQKRQEGVGEKALEACEYICVFTTLCENEYSPEEILNLYRLRWQIELTFKRLKSLMQIGHLPKREPKSARAWLQAKMLTVLLMEKLIEQARSFSPWGYAFRVPNSLARDPRDARRTGSSALPPAQTQRTDASLGSSNASMEGPSALPKTSFFYQCSPNKLTPMGLGPRNPPGDI